MSAALTGLSLGLLLLALRGVLVPPELAEQLLTFDHSNFFTCVHVRGGGGVGRACVRRHVHAVSYLAWRCARRGLVTVKPWCVRIRRAPRTGFESVSLPPTHAHTTPLPTSSHSFFLPPIILYAGLSVRKKAFFRNFPTIAAAGVLGTYASFALIAAVLWAASRVASLTLAVRWWGRCRFVSA